MSTSAVTPFRSFAQTPIIQTNVSPFIIHPHLFLIHPTFFCVQLQAYSCFPKRIVLLVESK